MDFDTVSIFHSTPSSIPAQSDAARQIRRAATLALEVQRQLWLAQRPQATRPRLKLSLQFLAKVAARLAIAVSRLEKQVGTE